MPRRIKPDLFRQVGLTYHYDIECAAPTIIQQYAQQKGLDTETPGIDQYINNKRLIRQHIADLVDIDVTLAKRIIQAITNNARVSQDPRKDVFRMVDCDVNKLDLLKQDEWLTQYRQDFRMCWRAIHPVVGEQFILLK